MDRHELAERYLTAWNEKNVGDVVRLMHAKASYYDAFWEERVAPADLTTYLGDMFSAENAVYRMEGDPILTQNGIVIRYTKFAANDHQFRRPIFSGAEILTCADGLITSVTDHYCDPNPLDLVAVAALAEKRHGDKSVVRLALSARTSSRIQRKLADIVSDMSVFRNPKLSVSILAEHVGCTVMQLFHVLEEVKKTTFVEFVAECRSRYATSLLLESSGRDLDLRRVAKQSGFTTVREFYIAFRETFGMSAEEYLRQFASKRCKA